MLVGDKNNSAIKLVALVQGPVHCVYRDGLELNRFSRDVHTLKQLKDGRILYLYEVASKIYLQVLEWKEVGKMAASSSLQTLPGHMLVESYERAPTGEGVMQRSIAQIDSGPIFIASHTSKQMEEYVFGPQFGQRSKHGMVKNTHTLPAAAEYVASFGGDKIVPYLNMAQEETDGCLYH